MCVNPRHMDQRDALGLFPFDLRDEKVRLLANPPSRAQRNTRAFQPQLVFTSADVWTERLTLTAITTFLPGAKTELAEVRCQVTDLSVAYSPPGCL